MQSIKADELPENPRVRANPLSALLLCFTIPIFFKGRKKTLDERDLYKALNEHKSETLGIKLNAAWEEEIAKKRLKNKEPNLLLAVIRVFGLQFLALGLLLFSLEIGLRVTQPLFLGGLVNYYANPTNKDDKYTAYIYAMGVILCNAINVLFRHPYMLGIQHIGMKVRLAMCNLIYRKALRLNRTALGGTTTGQVVNLISNDVGRLDTSIMHIHVLWVGPIEIAVVAVLMYREIGVASLFGVAAMLLFIPLQAFLGKMTSKLRLRTALRTDERVRMMNEIVSGIQVIKMYAWEKPFGKMIQFVRRKEMRAIRNVNYIRGILQSFALYMTRVSVFVSLVGYVLLGNFLTAEKAFVITAFYSILRNTMVVAFPNGIQQISETLVSMKRIKDYLLYEEIGDNSRISANGCNKTKKSDDLNGNVKLTNQLTPKRAQEEAGIEIRDLKARWDPTAVEYTLNNVNLNVKPRTLVAVIGPVGSGKSSLIQAILGELSAESGSIAVHGTYSYASQEPWLFTGTIRQNILFGLPMDRHRYRTVVKKCALERDFELLPHGDKTIVGERGASLSGGQKARISLARAVYRKADVYLLDDPLSAVDTHVGRHLFDQCMRGFLRDEIVLLVTHQLQFLEHADLIVIMDKGKVNAVGTYESMRSSGLDFANLLTAPEESSKHDDDSGAEVKSKSSQIIMNRQNSTVTMNSMDESIADSLIDEEADSPLQVQEKREMGKIGWGLYKKYFGASGGYMLFFITAFFCVGAQILGSTGDFYVSLWVNKNEQQLVSQAREFDVNVTNATDARDTRLNSNTDPMDIYIFFSIILAIIVFAIGRSLLFNTMTMLSSTELHNAMYRGITRAAMYFFHTNPSGRILNRFAKDLGQVDELLPWVMMDVIQNFLSLFGIVIVITIVNPQRLPSHDDVLGVVSHLDFMVTLLLVELHHCNKVTLPTADAAPPPAPCLEYMLSENLLDKLYEWGCTTGRYANAVRLEQLKLYELLVSHSRHQLLCHEPFLRPLLKILASSQGEIFPPDLEKRLVILLNQLCVVLMQNVHLLDLFFFSAEQEQHKQTTSGEELQRTNRSSSGTNFIIFSLLIPYVHREGSIGHQARDALLLCMSLSQKNSNVGTYIAQYSSMCPLLVTGLGGLYSRLPNSIEITSIDWHRITPDDVTEIPELTLFMNALEFCNAVVQVAHEMIKNQLLDFLYQGFIVPVLGPAILQTNIESQISAMSYLDLILRSVTEPGLVRAFVKFLLDTEKFDGERILDTLIDRLGSTDANLCMVTMALFDTLIGLHCEDLMLELLLKYILPGKHVPISHRHKINKIDPYINTVEFFLDLTPDVMKRARELTKHKSLGDTVTTQPAHAALPSPTSTMSKTIGANWNYYGLHTGTSLYANFHAYLFEAHCRIAQCKNACSKWTNAYKYQKWPPKNMRAQQAQTLELVKQFFTEFSVGALSDATHVFDSTNAMMSTRGAVEKSAQPDSLQSIGESSGYESFRWRPVEDDGGECNDSAANSTMQMVSTSTGDGELDHSGSSSSNGNSLGTLQKQYRREVWRVSSNNNELLLTDLDFSEDLFAQGTVSLGPFLNAIWGKLQTFTSNTLYVNLHLTGLITRLSCYPLPLVHSILLRPDIVITSDTPSFHQMLRILKQQIDAELPMCEDSLEIVDVARSYLIDREFRLINVRKASDNSPVHIAKNTLPPQHPQQRLGQQTTFANISSASPVQVTPSSSYDPFRRNDNKRKSISKSITNMFSRKASASSGLSQIYAFFTGGSTGSPFSNNGSSTTTQQQSVSSTRETSLTTIPSNTESAEQSHEVAGAHSSQLASSTTPSGSFSTNNTHNTHTTYTTLVSNSSVATLGGTGSEPVSLDSLSSMGAIANTSGTERTRDLALCAVLLDEWLKELAAIAQEQSVVLINENI